MTNRAALDGRPSASGWDDQVLACRVQEGDRLALAEADRRHRRDVVAFARRFTYSLSDAEDVAQDVFLTLWQRGDRFDPSRGTLRNFLFLLARHRSIDCLRAEQARTRREHQHGRSDTVTVDVARAVTDAATLAAVTRAIATLPPLEREPIRLAYLGGLTYRDVAGLLGVPEGTVKGRIRRGLRRLAGESELCHALLVS